MELKRRDKIILKEIYSNDDNYYGHYVDDVGLIIAFVYDHPVVYVYNRKTTSKYSKNRNLVVWYNNQVKYEKYDLIQQRKRKLNKFL